tara:strand:+ start:188 stop:427 length:240 start_codon:yes stop_codon:yes gene_type:complete
MGVKYFCGDCSKELKFEGFADNIKGNGWNSVVHTYDIGVVYEDRETEDITEMYQPICKECDLKNEGEASYYYEGEANEH